MRKTRWGGDEWVQRKMTGGDGSGKERKHSGPILNSPSDKTRHECAKKKKLMEWSKKARDCKWKSAVRWKWYGESNGRTGWSLTPLVSPPVSLPRSLSLSHREADTSLHPFDRSQKGGWIEEWRGVKERDERRRKGPKRGWAADGHLNARLPIFWKNERAEADTQTKTGMRAVCTKCSNTFAGSGHPCVQTWVWKRGGCSETLLLLAL